MGERKGWETQPLRTYNVGYYRSVPHIFGFYYKIYFLISILRVAVKSFVDSV